jgi:hypothetical protein
VGWLNPWTLYTTWRGKGEGSVVTQAHEEMRRMLVGREGGPITKIVCDTLAVTSYDGTLREPAGALLRELKGHGLDEIVVITRNPAIRMLGSALSLVVSCRFIVFAGVIEAHTYCAADAPRSPRR